MTVPSMGSIHAALFTIAPLVMRRAQSQADHRQIRLLCEYIYKYACKATESEQVMVEGAQAYAKLEDEFDRFSLEHAAVLKLLCEVASSLPTEITEDVVVRIPKNAAEEIAAFVREILLEEGNARLMGEPSLETLKEFVASELRSTMNNFIGGQLDEKAKDSLRAALEMHSQRLLQELGVTDISPVKINVRLDQNDPNMLTVDISTPAAQPWQVRVVMQRILEFRKKEAEQRALSLNVSVNGATRRRI